MLDIIFYSALVLPVIILLFSKYSLLQKILIAFICIILLSVFAEGYVDYMNKPWFSPPEDYSCDGPCYGWYSFERGIELDGLFTFLTGLLSVIISLTGISIHRVLKNARNRQKDKRSNNTNHN